jgi:photosystem II stability/assembly factor-like uncharacterized protein
MKKHLALLLIFVSLCTFGQKKKTAAVTEKPKEVAVTEKGPDLSSFKFRSVGPSFMSGRIIDLAHNPNKSSEYYVAVASGGVFKTTNGGTTFQPIFENYGAFSVGCVTLDPQNQNVVWVGTGEANNQRSVGYGDGIYKSEDGGKSFVNMGLKEAQHIGEIIIDPKNSDIIYVAAYGPLWNSGGERGVYKSTDGGKTWTNVLKISEHTGVADIVMDPKNSNVLYASAHQRQRKGYGYVSGGPESALYKSTDAGTTWKKINNGFPGGDIGRIAIAISPINTDVLYAHLEATTGNNGSYKSTDRGASWIKMSSYASSGLYYGKIYPDPVQFDRIFVGDVYSKYSNDGGKTWVNLNHQNIHVDNHIITIDPKDNQHIFMGGDGGLYESFNLGQNWHFKQNLSITQFYRVVLDNAFPFYNIYGGTQDNSSFGGPSRTTNQAGITNNDWYLTVGGDGFESAVDWSNPDIVYAQWQHGGLIRYDKKTGEQIDIKPVPLEGEPALRWNWDSPLLVSKYDAKRLYFGANKIYRSDDRGNSWKLISGDLSRQIDRNKLPYMDKVWSMDAVQKNTSTSIYGQSTFISESPLDENILYVGTDDGLVQVTSDGGKTWTKIDNIPGVPAMSYVPQVICSQHDKNTAYVVFNHHRYGDFKPYLVKTTDGGKTWTSISGNLPERGSVYTIAEDHVDSNLLFVGTEFGLFASLNGGKTWTQMKNNLPVIAIKDLEIQIRENDLVLATFGRGFYILDNYAAMRSISKTEGKEAMIFPIKSEWAFNQKDPLGGRGTGTQGDSYYTAENPPVGATIRYFVKETPKSLKDKRKENEKALFAKGELKGYPSLDSIAAEENEILGAYYMTILDEKQNVVRRYQVKPKKGMNEFLWNFSTSNGFSINTENNAGANDGLPVIPGKYAAQLSYFDGNTVKNLTDAEPFEVKSLGWATLPVQDYQALQIFANEVKDFSRIVNGTSDHVAFLKEKHKALKAALLANPNSKLENMAILTQMEREFQKINLDLNGNEALEKHQFEVLPGISDRIRTIVFGMYGHSTEPTITQKQGLAYAKKLFGGTYKSVAQLDKALTDLQKSLENNKIPYIQGSLPKWD